VTEAPTKLGLVGLGYWGPSLLRALFELPGVEVAWICDRDPDRLERYGRRYPSVSRTRRIDDILADDAVDGVAIATPVFTHYYLASRSLQAGKHTFVEKPLAASSKEADDLVRIAGDQGLALMCGHTFVYSPAVTTVKGILDRSELGQVFFVSSSRVNLGLHQRDTSVIWDLGPHDFSILLYWFGEMPSAVRAVGRDSIVKGVPDVAFVTLNFPSGLIANVELSWLAPSKLRRTVLVGGEKMVVYDDGSPEPIRIFDHGVVYEDPETFGEYQLSYRTGDIVSPKVANDEPIVLELADFIGMVRAGRAPEWQVELARNVAHLTEAAEESLRNGGKEVSPVVTRPARFERSAAAR
jgi:predicted dehydrogenase